MSREIRRVPATWQHPKDKNGHVIPLFEGPFDPERGYAPDAFMPDWPEAERTHLQMYESTTEGTPISPVCATPEECARWLADNGASAFGDQTASYEQWLEACRAGWVPSAVLSNKGLRSGVEAMSDPETQK